MKARIANFLNDTDLATKNDLKVILITTAIISLFLSFSQVLVDPVINSDGILYVQAGSFIQNNEWALASKLYNWLFYPYILANISTLFSISLEHSAYVVNAFFSAITCVSFVLIVKEFGGKNKAILCFSSVIILCFPNLNEYRNMVIRDHGYWAFYLLGCYFFIRAYKKPSVKTLTFLISSLTLASLFRVEGGFFLLTLPLLLLFRHLSTLKKSSLLVILIIAVTLVGIFTYSDTYQTINVSGFTKTKQLERAILAPVTKISSALNITETYINKLSPQGFSNDYSATVLSFIFILILFTEIFSATSPLYAITLSFALFKSKGVLKHPLIRPWIYLVSINIIILCGFLVSRYFIAGRYPIALALTLIIPLPFLAQWVYQKYQHKNISSKENKLSKVTATLFIILSIDGLVSTGASKEYLKDAGQWVASSTKEQKGTIFTNNQFVSFYAGNQKGKRIKEPNFDTLLHKIKKGKLKEFDILAIQINRKNLDEKPILLDTLLMKPIKIFENNKGDSVLVFKQ